MAIPKFFECFLRAVQDGELHTSKDVREKVAVAMQLSEADREEMLSIGKQRTFDNSVAWARTYLNKAGLIKTPLRGKYCITEEGKKALESGEKIDLKYLDRSEEFRAFHGGTSKSAAEFEKLVVQLLLRMGYGNGIDDAGMVTQQSNDGGIDGIIKEDQLSFSHIYIQAKQWALNQTVGKPEIQKFVGALQGQQAQKWSWSMNQI